MNDGTREGLDATQRAARGELTKRQREVLLLCVERGWLEWPYGMGGRPFHVLKDAGLVQYRSRSRGYHSHVSGIEPTDAGRALAEKLA